MDNRGLALVGFKLLGLWLAVQAASGAVGIAYVLQSDRAQPLGQAFSMAMLFAPSLVGGLTGVGIWLLADRLASGLFDREAPTPPRSRCRFVPDPLLVDLPILGAWLVAWALPELASGIALSVISRGGTQSVLGPIPYTADEQAMVWSATRKANEVGALVAGLVGLVLLLRSEQVAELLAERRPKKISSRRSMTSAITIRPILHPLNATVRVPGSKSLTNRALLIASLADGRTRLTNALFSDDSRYFAGALNTLGFDLHLDEENHEITVTGLGGKIPSPGAGLFIGNAGTAARFLSAFLTLGNGEYLLDGDARMRERPIGDLVEALLQLGARLEATNHCPPVNISASGLPGGKTRIAGNISSQFLSALLMIAPYAKSPVQIDVITELNSKPYVDMTLAIMDDFGITIERDGYQRFLVHPSFFSPLSSYPIESDASAASYFFAAPAICGGTSVRRLNNPIVQTSSISHHLILENGEIMILIVSLIRKIKHRFPEYQE